MSTSSNINANSCIASIWYAPSSIVLPDADKDEKPEMPLINIEALRTIRRLVLTIKERIAFAGANSGDDSKRAPAGIPSSTATTGTNSSPNTQGK